MQDWLKSKTTIQQAEAVNMVTNPQFGTAPSPFGFGNGEWRRLLAQMVDGDELWTFSSGEDSWEQLCGRAGIALVRRGEVVGSIITKMN
jgi:hypothetical protein